MTGNSQNCRTVHFSHEISRMQCKLYKFLTKLLQSLYDRVSKLPNSSKSKCFRQPMIHSYVNMSFSSGFHVTCVHVEIMEKLIKSAFWSLICTREWVNTKEKQFRKTTLIYTYLYVYYPRSYKQAVTGYHLCCVLPLSSITYGGCYRKYLFTPTSARFLHHIILHHLTIPRITQYFMSTIWEQLLVPSNKSVYTKLCINHNKLFSGINKV